jgi:hypothetical protein
MMVMAMTESLIGVIGLGILAGGAIVIIDSLILRRVRQQRPVAPEDDVAR